MEISVKLQAIVSDVTTLLADQQGEIERLKGGMLHAAQAHELRRLESIIKTFDAQTSGAKNVLARKDAEIDRLTGELQESRKLVIDLRAQALVKERNDVFTGYAVGTVIFQTANDARDYILAYGKRTADIHHPMYESGLA